jgi:hypothetical protein
LTSLTAIFGQSREEGRNSEKLLELYWNRAELKKEFANLRNETFRLKDEVKEQQGNAARAQQKFVQLENLLLDPEWVHNVAVFYQFRALNAHLERKLARFAEQLKQQREQRQHRQLLAAWTERRAAEAAGVEAEIGEVRERIRRANVELDAVQQKYTAMHPILRFFRRRSMQHMLDTLADAIEEGRRRELSLEQALDELARQIAPDVEGLDVPAKRSINCMILSFAQQVFLHFREDGVAAMAREAGNRSAGSMRYGSKADCDRLLVVVRRLRETMVKASECAELLQRRARLVAERAHFSAEDAAVPDSRSVALAFDIGENGEVAEVEADLLNGNYWGLSSVLSR